MPASSLPPNHAITTLEESVDTNGRIDGIRYLPSLQVKRVKWLGTWLGCIHKYKIDLTDGEKDIEMFFTTDKEDRLSLYKLLEAKGKQRMAVGTIVRLLQYKQKDGKIIVHKLRVVKRNSELIF